MIAFEFEVNESFLGYPSHPITVPKSQVSYLEIPAGATANQVVVVAPNGLWFEGSLYRGWAGYGEYYQIKVNSRNERIVAGLKRGQLLRIEMHFAIGMTFVRLCQSGSVVPHGVRTDYLRAV